METQIEENLFEKEISSCERRGIELANLNHLIQSLSGLIRSLASAYRNCYAFITANDGYHGRNAMLLMKQFQFELKEARIQRAIMKFIYFDEDGRERVCYALATDHPDPDMMRRINIVNQKKIFQMYKIQTLLKLPTRLYDREGRKFEKWEEFFNLHSLYYPRQTIRIRYIVINEKENFILIETKEEGFVARILLDHLGVPCRWMTPSIQHQLM